MSNVITLDNFDTNIVALVKRVTLSEPIPLLLTGLSEKRGFNKSKFAGEVAPSKERGLLELKLPVFAVLVYKEDAHEITSSLQIQLASSGYQALVAAANAKDFASIFQTTLSEAEDEYEGKALLVFFKSQEAMSLLWVMQTNGADYDLLTSDIVGKLEEWERECSFKILGAGIDWVELKFLSLPEDMQSFAEEVYEFCPDILEQGFSRPFSDKFEEEEEEEEEDFGYMEDELEEQDAGDLAIYLKKERQLFLWWD